MSKVLCKWEIVFPALGCIAKVINILNDLTPPIPVSQRIRWDWRQGAGMAQRCRGTMHHAAYPVLTRINTGLNSHSFIDSRLLQHERVLNQRFTVLKKEAYLF